MMMLKDFFFHSTSDSLESPTEENLQQIFSAVRGGTHKSIMNRTSPSLLLNHKFNAPSSIE
jgi:hypothetical protein